MAEQKIFAGPRLRRIRQGLALTQTAMAEGLGISPSYLNLIERNQRPLTVQLLLKLAGAYKVDPAELQGEGRGAIAALKEAFSEPLIAGELPGDQELIDLAENTPNAAAAFIKLHRAYREQSARLSDLSQLMAGESGGARLTAARLPADEVRDAFEQRPYHFAGLEAEADAFSSALGAGDDLGDALRAWLGREHGIAVKPLPVATMPNWRRRYDRHSQRLFISERLSPYDQLHEVAMEACLFGMAAAISAEVEALRLSSDEARRLARFEFARYAAHALTMPHASYRQAALRARYDIDVLRSRFRVSFEQAATRLAALRSAPGEAPAVPFFLQEIDHAGNRLRKLGAEGFPQRRFGGACPKLAIHAAFAQPGQILAEAVEAPDGGRFLTISRTLDGPQAAFGERPRRTAILLGCDIEFRDQVIYGAALPLAASPADARTAASEAVAAIPIGPACRLCERVGCLSRAEPPLTRPLGLDDMARGLSAFDFQ